MQELTTLSTAAAGTVAPRLYIEVGAWQRIQLYAALSVPNEVNGFGMLQVDDSGNFWLASAGDVYITEQKVMPGHAEYTGAGRAKLDYQLQQSGVDPYDLKLQWHSHVHGKAYTSSTDMKAVEGYGPQGIDFMLSMVTNAHGETHTRIDWFRPHRVGMVIDTVLYVGADVTDEVQLVLGEIDTHVTVVKPKRNKYSSSGYPEVLSEV